MFVIPYFIGVVCGALCLWFWRRDLKWRGMSINDFARQVTLKEGGKVSLSIAQIKEVLKVANELTNDAIYNVIKGKGKGVKDGGK